MAEKSTDRRAVIVGGHGKIALLAVPRLRRAGWSVTSLIRNQDHAADLHAVDAEPVVLSLEEAGVEDLAKVFAGADAVVFSAGAGGGNPARTRAVDYEGALRTFEAAEKAGATRFVMVSYARAAVDVDRLDPEDSFYPYAKAKHDADARLRETELDFTILGPGRLTLEDATEKVMLADRTGAVPGVELTPETAVTSRDNVAAVIAHVLETGAASRQTVNFYDGETPLAEAIR